MSNLSYKVRYDESSLPIVMEHTVEYLTRAYNSDEIKELIIKLKNELKKQSRHFILQDNDMIREISQKLIDEKKIQSIQSHNEGTLYLYTGRMHKYTLKKMKQMFNDDVIIMLQQQPSTTKDSLMMFFSNEKQQFLKDMIRQVLEEQL
jgi:hypothetical protein